MKIPPVVAAFVLTAFVPSAVAQFSPTKVSGGKPMLKRDRTQRILYPKIIQREDERTVTPDLMEMLLPPHGGARRRAVLAVGRIGYPSGLAPLIDILNGDKNPENRDPELRALAAFSLGQIQSQHAVAALLERIDPAIESSGSVRARSVEALGKIASNKLAAAALGSYAIAGISNAIARVLPAPDAPPANDTRLVGSMALIALARIKQATTVDKIAAQLKSPDPELRWQAANSL